MTWFEEPQAAKKIFGISESRLKPVIVPSSKVNCSYQFGEYYVYLSFRNLCLDDTICPLVNNRLTHDSCPDQLQDHNRVYNWQMNLI